MLRLSTHILHGISRCNKGPSAHCWYSVQPLLPRNTKWLSISYCVVIIFMLVGVDFICVDCCVILLRVFNSLVSMSVGTGDFLIQLLYAKMWQCCVYIVWCNQSVKIIPELSRYKDIHPTNPTTEIYMHCADSFPEYALWYDWCSLCAASQWTARTALQNMTYNWNYYCMYSLRFFLLCI